MRRHQAAEKITAAGEEQHVDMNRFTEKAQQALQSSQAVAVRRGHQQIDVEHLLLALLDQEPGLAVSILRKADVDVNALRQRLERELDKVPRVSTVSGDEDRVYLSGRLNRLLAKAEEEAKRFKDEYVSVEHLLLAMTEDTGAAGRLLKDLGVTPRAADVRTPGSPRQPARHHPEPRSAPTRRSRSTAAT